MIAKVASAAKQSSDHNLRLLQEVQERERDKKSAPTDRLFVCVGKQFVKEVCQGKEEEEKMATIYLMTRLYTMVVLHYEKKNNQSLPIIHSCFGSL